MTSRGAGALRVLLGRGLRLGWFFVSAPLRLLVELASEAGVVCGARVIGIEEAGEGDLDSLEQALKLIQEHAPSVFAHGVRDTRAIMLATTGQARYEPGTGYVLVSTRLLQTGDPEWIASSLVFVYCQARMRCRLGPAYRGYSFRVLRAAFERQVRFARRLPGSVPIVEELTRAWDAGFYNPQVQLQVADGQLKELGVQDRIRAWYGRVGRWLFRA